MILYIFYWAFVDLQSLAPVSCQYSLSKDGLRDT